MKAKIKQQKQDEQRRMNQAYQELAHAGGYIKIAYNEIKDRKGKMINGMFVKEVDLE